MVWLRATLAAIGTVGMIGAANAATELVTNGDFELTTNGSGQLGYNTQATGWAASGYNFLFAPGVADSTGTTGVDGNLKLWGPGDGSANGLTSSPSGGNYIAADGAYEVGAITQSISGLTIGQSYTLTFEWAGAQQYNFTSPTTEQWEVSLGGETFTTPVADDVNHGFTGWMNQSFTYTATATTELLSFLAIGTPSGEPPFSLLDGVSLQATPVPEPSSLILIIGCAAMAGVRHLKSRQRR
jgi:hypothetical protein